jgi:hypothetical protein
MTTVTVRIPTLLRSYTQGADEVREAGATVGEAMRMLGSASVAEPACSAAR